MVRSPHAPTHHLILTVLLACAGTPASAQGTVSIPRLGAAGADGDVRYGRDVRRILSDRCFACHGADPSHRQAGLRLDAFEHATAPLKGEGPDGPAAIAPGDLGASELWHRITSDDPDEVMPPPSAKKAPLDDEELRILRRWIEAGAEYERHWSFVPPQRPPLPGSTPEQNPVDAFVLARLAGTGLAPAPTADSNTLVRRLFLDLTGLPPTVDELREAAQALDRAAGQAPGDSDRVWSALVDRLLTTEPYRTRFAEHFATPWLDAARYADTIGIHTDNGRQMWPWRDWVLAALRDGMPYDRFATEQLAGDLLPEPDTDTRVASGFNRNHVITDEGGAINEEYLFEYAVDRVNTTSAVFLGLTAGCARCHDHKYDPLTQAEYYGMLAFFNSNDEPGLYSQSPDANRAFEPFLEVPSEPQLERLEQLERELEAIRADLEAPLPGEAQAREAFELDLAASCGLDWSLPEVLTAASSQPDVALELQPDGSLQAVGPEPDFEDYVLELATDATDQRLLLLEALATPGAGPGAGRASHGNSVVSHVRVEARPEVRPGETGDDAWRPQTLRWAWADHTQRNRDYEAINVLGAANSAGWAHDGNEQAGERDLLLLLDEPFGTPGETTQLRVTIAFRSPFAQHSIGRVRVRTSALSSSAPLPVAAGRWYRAGPFVEPSSADLYGRAYGPESAVALDTEQTFGAKELKWAFEGQAVDGEVFRIDGPAGITYMARQLWSPDERTIGVSLGSDDGIQVYLRGELVFENRVDRGVAPDQDRTDLALLPGHNLLVIKIVNTGGPGGLYYRQEQSGEVVGAVLDGELASALLPQDAVSAVQANDFHTTWRRRFFSAYRDLDDHRAERATVLDQARSAIPRAMVMRELDEPRPAFVMMRGQYDQPDPERPVERSTPGFLSPFPESAPADRLGFAAWLTADDHPLFARVAVNRLWQQVFGEGLVRTPEDFGLQGEWPTHPGLLDWLAVDFREAGWDLDHLLRTVLTSRTYRQSSAQRPELLELDPEGRLLAAYPRRRLSAEQIRDHALYVGGLLVEQLGGPSVKPYQPDGLWREVSMLASNTRDFVQGDDSELWRRSLYTYWKRAVPPPGLQTLDAPTRESCVIRRQTTNTPLQALLLWNDVQFTEAARGLALRTLAAETTDEARVDWLLLACTSREPTPDERALFLGALDDFRRRFDGRPEDAAALLGVGASATATGVTPDAMGASSEMAEPELAAWSLLASAALNLHETLTQD